MSVDAETPGTRILIEKAARRLRLSCTNGSERDYPVMLGRNAGVDKQVEGDHATPLGDFYVCAKNPRSRYFLSLCLSYPNALHAARGLERGLIDVEEHGRIMQALALGRMPPQHTRLGGEIYIHGHADTGGAAPRGTRGCIAVDNAAMRDLFDAAVLGTPVRIVE
jgi:murein L,D-transpeptidase YafK